MRSRVAASEDFRRTAGRSSDERDGAPVFHRACFEIAGNGDQVQLGQRVRARRNNRCNMAAHCVPRSARNRPAAPRRSGDHTAISVLPGLAAHRGHDRRRPAPADRWTCAARCANCTFFRPGAGRRGGDRGHVRNGARNPSATRRKASNRALKAGSSQPGNMRRASVAFELRHQHALAGAGGGFVVVVINSGRRIRGSARCNRSSACVCRLPSVPAKCSVAVCTFSSLVTVAVAPSSSVTRVQ
jgi:hypothetical protein